MGVAVATQMCELGQIVQRRSAVLPRRKSANTARVARPDEEAPAMLNDSNIGETARHHIDRLLLTAHEETD